MDSDKQEFTNSDNSSQEHKSEATLDDNSKNSSSSSPDSSPSNPANKSRRSTSLTARLRSFSFQKSKDSIPVNKEPSRQSFTLRPRSATFFKFSSNDSSPSTSPPTKSPSQSKHASLTANDISGSLVLNSPTKRTPVFIRLDMKKLSDIDVLSKSHTLHTNKITKSTSSPSFVRNRGTSEETIAFPYGTTTTLSSKPLSYNEAILKLQSIYRGSRIRKRFYETSK